MSSRGVYDKVTTIFGTMMIFFYLGLAYILIFSNLFPVDITLRVIFAFPLLLYGIYRAVTSYQKIRENFFQTEDD
jgi:uncharacterized membrane protein HdeD (DUF308 family)